MPRDDEGKIIEGAEKVKKTELRTLNSMQPLWTRAKSEIKAEEYNDFFRDFVAWLRSELDRVGATIPVDQQDEARRFFHRAVALERAFFDAVYTER